MKKVIIFALNKHRDAVLSKIQQLGMVQPIDLKKKDIDLEKPSDISNLKRISDCLLRVSRLVNIMKLPPKKLKFTQSVLGLDLLDRHRIQKEDSEETLEDVESYLTQNEKTLIDLEDKYTKLIEKEEELLSFKTIADIFDELNIPMDLLESTNKVSIISGKILTENQPKLETELNEKLNQYVHIISRPQNKKESIITVIGLSENLADISFLIKKYNVNIFTIPSWGIRKSPKEYVDSELKSLSSEKKSTLSDIDQRSSAIFEQGVVIREKLEILKNRFETIHNTLESEKFFILQGWILKKKSHKFEQELKKEVDENIVIKFEDPKETDNVPVKLANKKFFKPFEMLTELYALPKYRDLDPTFIVGPLFLIFAAFMLTDAIYGLFLVILGLFMYKKLAKYNEGIKNVSIIILGMGALTLLFGILTGSYFGDFPKYLWGVEPKDVALWKDPLEDPLFFLIISIGTAVVYLNIGFILGVIEDHRKKDYKTMFKERIVWFLIQIGVALLALGLNPKIPIINLGVATLLIILTVIAIVVTHGPLGLLGMTGLMGDMISFSRLFALSLSTAGIALAVNLLAELVIGTPIVGIILAAIIFLIGHMFGFVMNSIGSFVHSLRLQFVEFFGRFYEGGGDAFTPLKEERVYTEVEEE
tara:strand:- start:1939 stop:3879 length:1941 start_codon:yes stop_codon:yes gene_type:complete